MTLPQDNTWKVSFMNDDGTRESHFFTQEWKWDRKKKNLLARSSLLTAEGLKESIISIAREKITSLEEFESIDVVPKRFLTQEKSLLLHEPII